MRRFLSHATLAVLVGVSVVGTTAWADYYDGLRAFDSKDYTTAFADWKQAADQGDSKSQYRLGQVYQEGLGTPQNFIRAHVYYNLAAAQGHEEAAVARDRIAERMTTEELAEARKLAAEWQPSESAAADSSSQTRPDNPPQEIELPPYVLHMAAQSGDLETIRTLMDAGLDPDELDAESWTPLMFAAAGGHDAIVGRLLEAGADPTLQATDGATALLVAVMQGYGNIARALTESGADPNTSGGDGISPLAAALSVGNAEVVDILLEAGTDVNVHMPDGGTPLMAAVQAGNGDLLVRLLENGADPNVGTADGVTPLMMAVDRGEEKAFAILIQRGADPAAKTAQGIDALALADAKKNAGIAAVLLAEMPDRLPEAAARGLKDVVNTQIARGADVNKTLEKGRSPLIVAAAQGDVEVVKTLLTAGAKVHHADDSGLTALMAATFEGHVETVKVLVEAGANAAARNKTGASAHDIASEKGFKSIAAILAPPEPSQPDPQVREAQRLLTKLGYRPGPIDGLLGKRTTSAVEVFQSDQGIAADGKITEQLLAALRNAEKRSVSRAKNVAAAQDRRDLDEAVAKLNSFCNFNVLEFSSITKSQKCSAKHENDLLIIDTSYMVTYFDKSKGSDYRFREVTTQSISLRDFDPKGFSWFAPSRTEQIAVVYFGCAIKNRKCVNVNRKSSHTGPAPFREPGTYLGEINDGIQLIVMGTNGKFDLAREAYKTLVAYAAK